MQNPIIIDYMTIDLFKYAVVHFGICVAVRDEQLDMCFVKPNERSYSMSGDQVIKGNYLFVHDYNVPNSELLQCYPALWQGLNRDQLILSYDAKEQCFVGRVIYYQREGGYKEPFYEHVRMIRKADNLAQLFDLLNKVYKELDDSLKLVRE